MGTLPTPTRDNHWLLLWVLTACAAVAGPALLGVAQGTPDLTLASVAIGLSVLAGFVLRQSRSQVRAAAAPGPRLRTLGWSRP